MAELKDILIKNNIIPERRGTSPATAMKRGEITRLIGNGFEAFDPIRRHCINQSPLPEEMNEKTKEILQLLLSRHLIRPNQRGGYNFSSKAARNYLEGQWLEEYVWLAILEAGADEAFFAQHIWICEDQLREVDCIARKEEELIFISCKCYRPYLISPHLEKKIELIDYAIEEIEFFERLFSVTKIKCGLVVSTDLIDEINCMQPRYPALQEKARKLGVHLIGGDHLEWRHLTGQLHEIITM